MSKGFSVAGACCEKVAGGDPPLVIEMVLPSLAAAGMETMTAALARALVARGHRVGVTCLQEEGSLAQGLRAEGVAVNLVPCPGLAPNLLPGAALRNHFARCAPDIVHAHQGVWAKAAIAARAAGVPGVIHTAHGFVHNEPWFNTPLRWWAARHTDLVVAVSAPLHEYLVKRACIPRGRVRTIINGVDVRRFAPGPRSGAIRARFGIPVAAPLVGCVARFDPIKNHALLLAAMEKLRPELPEVRLALIGDGPLGAQLRQQAQTRGLDDRVVFAGEFADLTSVYRELDAFVLPSFSEGTSISILEAMASGVPVVATAVGGTPRLLANGACGELVKSNDVDALAAALRRVLVDPRRRARLAAAGRARALAEFDDAMVARQYESVYRAIKAAHRSTTS